MNVSLLWLCCWVYQGDVRDERDAMSEDEKPIPAAAKRALAEAEERRRKAKEQILQVELGGRDGPDPVRYGDWEKKGIAIDF
jgi:hypothetical protein